MIRGLYTAAAGMLAMQQRQEVLANNLANINTPGYKQDVGVMRAFPEQLIARIRDQEGPNIQGLPVMSGQPAVIGRLHSGVYMSEALPIFRQGDIAETRNPYDVALLDNLQPDQDGNERRLFFSVARLDNPGQAAQPDQIRYTRNGNWSVNADGYLVTSDGYYVLDNQNRAIRVNDPADPANSAGQQLKIGDDGALYRVDEAGNALMLPGGSERLGLKVVTNPLQLVREGTNIYRWEGGGQPEDLVQALQNDRTARALGQYTDPAVEGRFGLKQGWLERANVDPAQTMTDMMTALRAYEANQRVITTVDGTLEKAANEIGRVNG
ncbi:flagellar basal-body rod protein FlgG [Brevibacillus aydinogluensis]|uniref:flagellar hook-basal body protein n=1 Tax=Brevibacillus aydinogluensis TaxID=927786 RepID=UPI002892BB80|nr:flagellar hook-basal body protein [Brevibacillus aydinogluensis]MDT3417823.1 flagellar basal-body rod protein FlgG [Brevibacillus aydinogluensis]